MNYPRTQLAKVTEAVNIVTSLDNSETVAYLVDCGDGVLIPCSSDFYKKNYNSSNHDVVLVVTAGMDFPKEVGMTNEMIPAQHDALIDWAVVKLS